MMAPPPRRWAVIALYAFNLELARIPDLVSEPLLGRMRLQWWRDIVESGRAEGGNAALLLAAVEAFDLDKTDLARMIDARESDLGDDGPPADMSSLVNYATDSGGALGALVHAVLSTGTGDAAGRQAARHAGTAYTLTGIARATPFDAAKGRNRLPADLLPATMPLEQRGTDSSELRAAVRAVTDAATAEIGAARGLVAKTGRERLAAFTPATLAESYIATLRRCSFDPYDPRVGYRGAGTALKLAFYRFLGRF